MMRQLLLAVLLVLVFPGPAAPQVRVTPDTHLENVHGDSISYERFVELVDSGRFVPEPVRNDEGEVVGYRLAPERPDEPEGPPDELTGPIRGLDGAVEVPMEVADRRLLVPATLYGPRGRKDVLFLFDTGTFAPVVWLPEIRDAVGARDGYLDSVSVAGVTVERPVTGSYSSPDALRRGGERAREAADRFGDRPVAGILGGSTFADAIVSLDAGRERLVLRPADSERRTLFDREPLAAVPYRDDLHNVWIPATVNGQVGYAQLDTGNFGTWIDIRPGPGGTGRPDSLVVDGVDLLPRLSGAAFREVDRTDAYAGVPLDVIANLGTDALGGLIVTVDGPRGHVYFECPPAGTGGTIPRRR